MRTVFNKDPMRQQCYAPSVYFKMTSPKSRMLTCLSASRRISNIYRFVKPNLECNAAQVSVAKRNCHKTVVSLCFR